MKIFFLLFLLVFTFSAAAFDDTEPETEYSRMMRRLEKEWEVKSYYHNAVFHMKNAQWDKAMYAIRHILEIQPDHEEARTMIREIDKKRWEGFEKLYGDDIPARKTIGLKRDYSKLDTFLEDIIPLTTEAKKYFILGEEKFLSGNLIVAETYFRMTITRSPSYALAYQRMGEIYLIRNDLELAKYCFEKSIQHMPGSQESRLYLADIYLMAKDYATVRKMLPVLMKIDPLSEVTALCRGIEYRISRETTIIEIMNEQKIDEERFINFSQKQERELSGYAYGHYYYLEKARKANPDFWFTHYLLAYAYMMTFNKDDAVRALESSQKLAPAAYSEKLETAKKEMMSQELRPYQFDSLDFHLAKAEALYKKGFYGEAITEIVLALSLDPQSSAAHVLMGKCFTSMGNISKAIDEYRQAISLDEKNFEAYFLLGCEFLNAHQYDDGVETLKTACSINENNTESIIRLAQCYMGLEDFGQAMDSFKKALKIDSQLPKAHLGVGYIYTEQSEFEKALASFEEAIRIDPGYFDAHVNMGIVYFKMWEIKNEPDYLDRAISSTEEALRIAPDNSIIKDYLNFYKGRKQ